MPPVLVTARRSCPLQSAAMDPAPVPRALQAARPRRSSTATQCDMMVFTVEDMASNFSNGCRRKSGRPEIRVALSSSWTRGATETFVSLSCAWRGGQDSPRK